MELKCKVEVGEIQIKNLLNTFGSIGSNKSKPIKSLTKLDSIAKKKQKESNQRVEHNKFNKGAK